MLLQMCVCYGDASEFISLWRWRLWVARAFCLYVSSCPQHEHEVIKVWILFSLTRGTAAVKWVPGAGALMRASRGVDGNRHHFLRGATIVRTDGVLPSFLGGQCEMRQTIQKCYLKYNTTLSALHWYNSVSECRKQVCDWYKFVKFPPSCEVSKLVL